MKRELFLMTSLFVLIQICTIQAQVQSAMVYESGTGLISSAPANICADTLIMNGTYSGDGTFCSGIVSVEPDDSTELITNIVYEYGLSQNYPNPFNPSTRIQYEIPKSTFVRLSIFDVLGKEVQVLVNEEKIVGQYNVVFDAQNLASGIYFYKLQADNFIQIKKMILVK